MSSTFTTSSCLTPAIVQEYSPDIGQTIVGGCGVSRDPYCHKVERVLLVKQCEPGTKTMCYTQSEEITMTTSETNITCFDKSKEDFIGLIKKASTDGKGGAHDWSKSLSSASPPLVGGLLYLLGLFSSCQ